MRFLIVVVAIGLSVVMVAGCTDSDQEENRGDTQRQDSSARTTAQTQERTKEKAQEQMQSVTGILTNPILENQRFVLRPKEGDRVLFRYNPKVVEVTLDGEETGPESIKKGQRVKVDYVVSDGKEIARSVRLQSAE